MVYKLGDVDWDKFADKYQFGRPLGDLDQSLTEYDGENDTNAREDILDYSREELNEVIFTQADPVSFLLYDTRRVGYSEEAYEVIEKLRCDGNIYLNQSVIDDYRVRLEALGVRPSAVDIARLLYVSNPIAYNALVFDGEAVTCRTYATADDERSSGRNAVTIAVDIDPRGAVDENPESVVDHFGADAVLPIRLVENEPHPPQVITTQRVRIEDAIETGCGASND